MTLITASRNLRGSHSELSNIPPLPVTRPDLIRVGRSPAGADEAHAALRAVKLQVATSGRCQDDRLPQLRSREELEQVFLRELDVRVGVLGVEDVPLLSGALLATTSMHP